VTGDTHSAGKPFPLCDLWLAVDEEQTLHFGLRRAWHWLEATENTPRRGQAMLSLGEQTKLLCGEHGLRSGQAVA